jgi:hypothetical protein
MISLWCVLVRIKGPCLGTLCVFLSRMLILSIGRVDGGGRLGLGPSIGHDGAAQEDNGWAPFADLSDSLTSLGSAMLHAPPQKLLACPLRSFKVRIEVSTHATLLP